MRLRVKKAGVAAQVCGGTAVVSSPALESGFVGPVSALFSQAPFLRGRPQLFLPPLPPRLYSDRPLNERTRVASGLPALLRARAGQGLPWCLPAPPPVLRQRPPAAALRSRSAFPGFLLCYRCLSFRRLGRPEREGTPDRHLILGKLGRCFRPPMT